VSFDNIAQSLELVFVIISTNTFTDIMYYTIDAEYMVAALCMPHDLFPLTTSLCHIVRPPRVDLIDSIIVLSFWLVNLVIAVITSSFQVTRDEMQQSAFVSKRQQYVYCCN
jgi:voltage-dependent calcium channel